MIAIRARRTQAGFSLLIVMFAIVFFGLGLAAIGESWSRDRQRQRETELLRTGREIATAIGRYYQTSPGVAKAFPKSLDDLLEDKRFVAHNRYLRRVYRDPMTNKPTWGLIEARDGGIAGVYSLSKDAPLRQKAVDLGGLVVGPATQYAGWRFAFDPDRARTGAGDDRGAGSGSHPPWTIPMERFR